MSTGPPLFNIPNTKRNNFKLPSLSIPPISNYDTNAENNTNSLNGNVNNVNGLSILSLLNPPISSSSSSSSQNTVFTPSMANPKLKRKLPPIDFSKVDGSHSFTTESKETISPVKSADLASPSMDTTIELDGPVDKNIEELTPQDWNVLANTSRIIEISKLGEGNGGSVSKCTLPSQNGRGQIFALKLINTDPNPNIQKQIIRELQYNRSCNCPNIVKYYGTFMVEKQSMIGIAMEYMGGRSLDAIYKRVIEIDPTNRINEKVLGKMALSVLHGLNYLHKQRIIHRDIKPSNILLDSQGNVKLCDFGVSGEVVNSLATTFVGTQYYMAPERIMGKPYTVTCDIWSLGLTMLEVATCRFPLTGPDDLANLGPIELLSLILEYEPKLQNVPSEDIYWSEAFESFISFCLRKNSDERPSPRQMLGHPWCVGQLKVKVNMDRFVKTLWEDL